MGYYFWITRSLLSLHINRSPSEHLAPENPPQIPGHFAIISRHMSTSIKYVNSLLTLATTSWRCILVWSLLSLCAFWAAPWEYKRYGHNSAKTCKWAICGSRWVVEANICFKWLKVPLKNKNKVPVQWNSQVPFSKAPLSPVKCEVTPFDRVYALADHMKAKPAQQFPQKKCSLLMPPGSRHAVTNGVIIMPQTEYPDNSVLLHWSHSVPLHDRVSPSSLEKNLVHITTVNSIPGHITSHQR